MSGFVKGEMGSGGEGEGVGGSSALARGGRVVGMYAIVDVRGIGAAFSAREGAGEGE
jgi:hypothetical protein